MAHKSRGFDTLHAYAHFGPTVDHDTQLTVAGTEFSSEFSVPRAIGAVRFHVPDLDGVTALLAVQALNPLTNTFNDIFIFDPSDGTSTTPMANLPESQVTVVPASAIGGGVCRLRAYTGAFPGVAAVQTTVNKVYVVFDRLI